jgi:hypothetical protein
MNHRLHAHGIFSTLRFMAVASFAKDSATHAKSRNALPLDF